MPIFNRMVSGKIYSMLIKPFFDGLVGLILLLISSPILIVVAVLVSVDIRQSPIFVQIRIGKNEKEFKLFKFKTMAVDNDEKTATRIGKFLRATSLDELPQLFNVICGDMSLVGPRPLLPEYLPYYNDQEKLRHSVKPGITGWAQVNGRNEIDWGKRMEMDTYYIGHQSLLLDLKILIRTSLLILKRDRTPYKKGVTIKFSEYASKR